jgi:hypothetical protein
MPGAEGHANAKFAAPARHTIRHDAVQAQHGEKQCEPAEQRREHREQLFLLHRTGELRRERDERLRGTRIDFGERGLDRRLDRHGAAARTHFEACAHRQHAVLGQRHEGGRLRIFAQRLILCVGNETDDLDRTAFAVALPQREVAAEHVACLEEALGHGLVHDRDERRRGAIAIAEIAAREKSRAHRGEVAVAGGIEPGQCVVHRLGRVAGDDHLFIPRRATERREV